MLKSFVSVDNISYNLPDNTPLFQNVSFSVNRGDKIALIGGNGAGKTTLARIVAGIIPPADGTVTSNADIFYAKQSTFPANGTVESVLDIKGKLSALAAVESGSIAEEHFAAIGQDWDIREQIDRELAFWNFSHISLMRKRDLTAFSGGEQEKILLAGAFLSGADIIIFDEPTNNLDASSRALFTDRMMNSPAGVLIISHDRGVLENIPAIMELSKGKLNLYGGNYSFYRDVKEGKRKNLEEKQSNVKSELRRLKSVMAKDSEKAIRSEKVGKSKIAKSRYPRIAANALKGLSEVAFAKKREVAAEKVENAEKELTALVMELKKPKITIPMPKNPFIRDCLAELKNVTFTYGDRLIFENLSFSVFGGERMAFLGDNGAGKTTLVKLIMGILEPQTGNIKRFGDFVYLDQNLSIINPEKSLLANICGINPRLTLNEAHATLANFNFRNVHAGKLVKTLSGGELLRCSLAAVLATETHPDLIIMDEPTNNLDIESLEILESALNQYRGGLIIISHDQVFLENVGIGVQLILE